MKFEKFVKSIGSNGIIYIRKNSDRWLSEGKVFMKIPEHIRSITACDIQPMPDYVDNIINRDSFTEPCYLHKALMPFSDGNIKNCVRVYATDNVIAQIAIRNDDYTLLERRKDIVEMFTKTDTTTMTTKGLALVIKETDFKETDSDETMTIGVIFPTTIEVEDK